MKLNVTEILNFRKQNACSTLLEFQNFKFLFDCGLSPQCSIDDYKQFDEKLRNIDIIFLSRSDRSYSGALTFLISEYKFEGKIFSTLPVKYLSSLNHQIYHLNRISKNSFDKQKISEYFTKSFEIYDRLIELKFKQKVKLQLKGFEVKVEAFCCGNSIGASFWNVSIDGMSFGYLVQYNHQSEIGHEPNPRNNIGSGVFIEAKNISTKISKFWISLPIYHIQGAFINLDRHLNGYNPIEFHKKNFDVLITSPFNIKGERRSREDIYSKISNIVNSAKKEKASLLLFLSSSLSRIIEIVLRMEEIITRIGKPKKTRLILFSSLNQYLGIMRSLSEFMNSKLSTYIFGDDKKFLFFKFFRVFEYEKYMKEDKEDFLDIVVDLTTEVALGRKHKLLEEVNSHPKNQLIFVDEIPDNFDVDGNCFVHKTNKQDMEAEVERILEKPEILVPSGDEDGDFDGKNEDKTSTKAPSVIQGNMEQEDIDEEKQAREVNFNLDNGFYSFAKFQEIKEETFYGRIMDSDMTESLQKLNMISNAHPGKDLDTNLLNNNSNFDFFESLHNVEEVPGKVQIASKAECLNLMGISEGYSMEIILRNLNANTVVLVNGNKEENECILSLNLNKKKIRGLNEEKKIYKGSLHRSRLKAVFTKDEPEDLDFKTLRGEELYYAKVKAKVEVQYDKKSKKIIHKNSLITILDDADKTSNEISKKNKDEGELVYSSLDKFRLVDFKNYLKEEGIETKVECGRLNVKDKVYVVQSKGKLTLDGIFSEEYFKVRRYLYKMMMIKA